MGHVPRLVLCLALLLLAADSVRPVVAAVPHLGETLGPVVTLSPAHGQAGTTVLVSACRYAGGQAAELASFEVTLDDQLVQTLKTDDCGSGKTGFGDGTTTPPVPVTIPPNAAVGPHLIAVDLFNLQGVIDTSAAYFTVDPPNGSPVPTPLATPTATLNPTPDSAGTGIGVCGLKELLGKNLGGLLPEWAYVRPDLHFVQIDGTAYVSHPSSQDFPSNHTTHDMNVLTPPDVGEQWLLGPANLYGGESERGRIEAEWEMGSIPEWAWPSANDRVRIGGAWVYDCGHVFHTKDDAGNDQAVGFRTEIHAPSLMVTTRHDPTVDELGTNGRPVPVTRTDIYAGAPPSACTHDGCALGAPLTQDEVFDLSPPDPGFGQDRTVVCRVIDHEAGVNVGSFTRIEPQVQAVQYADATGQVTPAHCRVTLPFSGLNLTTGPVVAASVEAGYTQSDLRLVRTQITLTSLHINDAIEQTDDDAGAGDWRLWVNLNDQWLPINGLGNVRNGDNIPLNDTISVWSRTDGPPSNIQLFAAGYSRDCIDTLYGKDLSSDIQGLLDRADNVAKLVPYIALHLGAVSCIVDNSGNTGTVSGESCIHYPDEALDCAESPLTRSGEQPWLIPVSRSSGDYTASSDTSGEEARIKILLNPKPGNWWLPFISVLVPGLGGTPLPPVSFDLDYSLTRSIDRAYRLAFHMEHKTFNFGLPDVASDYVKPSVSRAERCSLALCTPKYLTTRVSPPNGPGFATRIPAGWKDLPIAAGKRPCVLGYCGGAAVARRLAPAGNSARVDVLTYRGQDGARLITWMRGAVTHLSGDRRFKLSIVAGRPAAIVYHTKGLGPPIIVLAGKRYIYAVLPQAGSARLSQDVDTIVSSLSLGDGYQLPLHRIVLPQNPY